MYAIRNKRVWPTRWVYGTDFTRSPHTQRTSEDKALIFETREEAELEYKRRMCGKTYEIIAVRLEAIE